MALPNIFIYLPAETVNIVISEQIVASITNTVQYGKVGSDKTAENEEKLTGKHQNLLVISSLASKISKVSPIRSIKRKCITTYPHETTKYVKKMICYISTGQLKIIDKPWHKVG